MTTPKPAPWWSRPGKMGLLLELALVVFAFANFLILIGLPNYSEQLLYRPVPDAIEYSWVANAFANGGDPLLPIGNDLHPSRYSPMHPWLMSVWQRMNMHSVTSHQSFGRAAVVAGLLALYLGQLFGGVTSWRRVVFLVFAVTSPAVFWAAHGLMAESSLIFLFGVGTLLWWLGIVACGGPRAWHFALGCVAMLLTGMALAGLLCLRPTTGVLGLAAGCHVLWSLRRGRALAALASMAVGSVAIFVLCGMYIQSVSGRFGLTAYFHWMPTFEPFAWRFAWIPINGEPAGMSLVVRLIIEELGFIPGLTLLGPLAMLPIAAGCVIVLRRASLECSNERRRAREWRRQAVVLIIAGISLCIGHAFYQFYDPRFFVSAHLAFVAGGLLGIETWFRRLAATATIPVFARRSAMATLGVCLLTVPMLPDGLTQFALAGGADAARNEEIEALIHSRNRRQMRRLRGPLFVHRVSVVNARLLLGLDGTPLPISILTQVEELYFNGHTLQFLSDDVLPARGHVDASTIWGDDPSAAFLYDTVADSLHVELLVQLEETYPEIGLYFPSGRTEALKPLLTWLEDRGWTLTDYSRHAYWRFLIAARPSGLDNDAQPAR